MGDPELEPMSVEDFLAWIETQDHRHELVDGLIVRLMAGVKQGHNVVTSNIVAALAPRAKAANCRTTSSDTAVRTGPTGVRYPDVVVDRGPRDASAMEAARPVVVVKVSSPATSTIDATDKLDEYRSHNAIRVIMLVDSDVVSVKPYRRDIDGQWAVEKYDALDQVVDLPENAASLALGEIYDTLDPKDRSRLRIVADEAPAPAAR